MLVSEKRSRVVRVGWEKTTIDPPLKAAKGTIVVTLSNDGGEDFPISFECQLFVNDNNVYNMTETELERLAEISRIALQKARKMEMAIKREITRRHPKRSVVRKISA